MLGAAGHIVIHVMDTPGPANCPKICCPCRPPDLPEAKVHFPQATQMCNHSPWDSGPNNR